MGSKTSNYKERTYRAITMRLITAFCVFMSCHCSDYIQVREKILVGEDQKLTRLLKERTGHKNLQLQPMKLPRQYYENQQLSEISLAVYNQGRRKYKPHQDDDKTGDLNLVYRAVDLMQHAVYHTQYRLRDLQRIINVYKHDFRFRIAFIFARLDSIIRDMRIIYSVVNRTLLTTETEEQTTFYKHLNYYAYFLRHNHDVTYIVEYLITIHTDYQLKESLKKQKEKEKEQKKHEKGTPDNNTEQTGP